VYENHQSREVVFEQTRHSLKTEKSDASNSSAYVRACSSASRPFAYSKPNDLPRPARTLSLTSLFHKQNDRIPTTPRICWSSPTQLSEWPSLVRLGERDRIPSVLVGRMRRACLQHSLLFHLRVETRSSWLERIEMGESLSQIEFEPMNGVSHGARWSRVPSRIHKFTSLKTCTVEQGSSHLPTARQYMVPIRVAKSCCGYRT